jgi:dTDP-glucose 4,6-dehydratase
MNPIEFVKTNVLGTINLLNVSKSFWKDDLQNHRFHHVSTDEVYGALDMNPENKFTETTPYNPHSPYSAAKASSDHFVKAYHDTYGMNVTISNCSNNYGPNQFPEKLIPLVINNLKEGRKIPVYGTGENIRDWLYVEEHAEAIDLIFHKGVSGETYNVGGKHEMMNIDIVKVLINVYTEMTGGNVEDIDYDEFITFVTDRAGHDLRYAIDCSKMERDLGWKPKTLFREGIKTTVKWYLDNTEWLNNITSGDYKKYYEEMYQK